MLPPQAEFFLRAAPYNLMIAGQGSGKSFDIGMLSGMFITHTPKIIGLIAANTSDQLSRATLKTTFETWREYFGYVEYDAKSNPGGHYVIGKNPPYHFVPHGHTFASNNNNIYLANGAVIFTTSLHDYKGIEGVEVGWAMLDETADTNEEALTSVITGRLRQKGLCIANKRIGGETEDEGVFPYCPSDHPQAGRAINPLFVFTKPAKVPWINNLFDLESKREQIQAAIYDKSRYFHSFDGVRQVVIYSVWWNRDNLPQDFIANRLKLLAGSGLVNSHFYGDPFSKTGSEFVTEFDPIKHIGHCAIAPAYPLHLSIDFNAKPYMTGLVMQLVPCDGEWNGLTEWIELRVVDEYALVSPKNTAGHLAGQFCEDYGDLAMMGLYVYGDASGNNEVPMSGAKSYFDDLTLNLDVPYELRVPEQNPRYAAALGKNSMGRKAFTNAIFSGAKGVRVLINPRCVQFIADLTYCKEDANGRMEKKKNKEGVEERGHHLDAGQYFICHPKSLGYLAKFK